MPPAIVTTFLLLTVLLVLLPPQVAAFGAGDIPDFSYLEGKAFRHGDIENTLLELVKAVAHSHGGGLLGFAKNVLSTATGGTKFSKEDVKHVYFGNWLRDYSQAMDIAGLSKLSAETLVLIVGVLGFLEFGFATVEFEVTEDRLGVYLPVEHIDNPRGYAQKEGDARTFHAKLRPPVDPRELEIDSRTGMKNYMATENRGWDTSTAFIRRTLRDCIQRGRNAGGREGPDLFEAYRLLGQGLHTLEDFTAHSNWVEIALRKLGHNQVYCHVGDNVYIDSPSGRVPPIVTGTFGGADFFHSLLGETTDKISQSSVTDLSAKMSNNNSNAIAGLQGILGKLKALGGSDSDSQMNQAEEMKRKSEAYHFNPNEALPREVVKNLREVLKFHDDVMRSIIKKIEMIPGLSDLLDGLSNALNAFVYTTIAPYVTPVLTQVTSAVGEGSAAVISSADQWEVFNDPNASDPTHSVLSKDHFGIILNEPAGKVAKVVVEHSVNLVVEAWSTDSNPDDAINKILEAFHHPYYNNGRSEIQNRMIEVVDKWLRGMDHSKAQETIGSLTKEAIRQGRNKRQGEGTEGQESNAGYSGGYSTGNQTGGNYGGSTQQTYVSGDSQKSGSRYGSGGNNYEDNSYDNSASNTRGSPYGGTQGGYGRSDKPRDQTSYGQPGGGYGRGQETSYSQSDGRRNQTSYDQSSTNYGGGQQTSYGQSEDPYTGRVKQQTYGQPQDNDAYGNTRSGYQQTDNAFGDNRGGYDRSSNRSYELESTQSRHSYGENQGGRGKIDNKQYERSQSDYVRQDDDPYVSKPSGYDSQSRNTYQSSPARHHESGENPYGGSQRVPGGSGDNYNPSTFGREDRSGGYGGSEGYGSKRDDNDKPYSTSGHRSGYQPSYQPSSQTEANYNTPGSYGGGNNPYSGNEGSGYGHQEGHVKKSHHKKHHDDDDETYGAEKLNLRDDDDDEKRRRGYGGGGYGGNEGRGSRSYGDSDRY